MKYQKILGEDAAAIVLSLTVVAYVASLFLTAIVDSHEVLLGGGVLLLGWLGPLAGSFAWFANPPLIFAMYFSKEKPSAAMVAAFFGFALALTTFGLKIIPSDNGSYTVLGFGAGCYLWLACFPAVFFASFLSSRKSRALASGE
ncbi:hypothetical protein IGS61_02885 [Janthinobacterium sp. FW305-129]|uniref:hypothetical protein n=1 Tax=Janthinobacterium sp. FW305-129 TaxID=2775054 RepID=UPI001E5DBC28|nr:hypothetical protein [Janthinobacterium sp. FW305-129]MCC7596415.1 hypothetical protein [Janthinobacterium sp. FW305-129]